MYTRTPQPGLWFIAGSLAQCRINSKYLALQIKAIEEGLLPRGGRRFLPLSPCGRGCASERCEASNRGDEEFLIRDHAPCTSGHASEEPLQGRNKK